MLQPPSSTSASLTSIDAEKINFYLGVHPSLSKRHKNGMGDSRKAHDACNIEDEEYDHYIVRHNHGHVNDDISDDADDDDDVFVGTFRWLSQAIAL